MWHLGEVMTPSAVTRSPTLKQTIGIGLILSAAVVSIPLESIRALLACGVVAWIGVLLLLKGGQP